MSQIFIVHGNDEFLVDEAARNALKTAAPTAEADGVLTTVAGDVEKVEDAENALKQVLLSIQSLSMFGDKNVTWLRRATFLPGGKLFKSEVVKEGVERLQDMLAAGLGPEQILIISCDKIDSRSRFLKALKGKASFEEHSRSAKKWEAEKEDKALLANRLKERGIKAKPMILESMMARIGDDHRLLNMEIEKLDVFLGDRREVTPADVDLMISANREVPPYEFCGAVAEAALDKALMLLRRLEAQKASPVGIMAQLMNQFREMAVYRAMLQNGGAQLQQNGYRTNLNWVDETSMAAATQCLGGKLGAPFKQALLANLSMKYSVAELDRMLRMVADAYHDQFRSSLPAFLQIELLVVRMLAGRRGRRSA